MAMTERPMHAAAPQSWAEVGPVEAQLRLLDDAIRIEWEPRAVMIGRGSYDANGKAVDPKYRGLWKVIKLGDPNRTATWRDHAIITYVTVPTTIGSGAKKVHAMQADGPYAPVGDWLVEHMRSWDRANREAALTASAVMDEWNAKRDEAALLAGQDGEAELLERVTHQTAMRGGVTTSHPVAVNLTTE